MTTSKDLTKLMENYKGLWVVLNRSLNRIISANKNAKKAYNQAIKKGEIQPTLFKVPEKNLPYFGIHMLHGKI